MSAHTPGPWKFEMGYGHGHNSIVGSDLVQVNGWVKPRGNVNNAIYSNVVCENFGDTRLPGPLANVRLITAAPELLDVLEFIMDGINGDNGSYVSIELHKTFLEKAREIISKAKRGRIDE